MALFGCHQGQYAVDIADSGSLDITASRTENKFFLHIANPDMHTAQTLKLAVEGKTIQSAVMHYIDADPAEEIGLINPHCFDPKQKQLDGDTVIIPAAAVATIEITAE